MNPAALIAANLEHIRQEIAAACDRCSRQPEDVLVLGASKSQPLDRLRWAWDAGLRIFGENRVQEALAKMPELPENIEWHLIGPLQSNKAKKVAPAFAAVHSIDRLKIARVLARELEGLNRTLTGFLEINLAEEETKHGFRPEQIFDVLDDLADLEQIQFVGLMAIPPFDPDDPQASRPWFRKLRELRDRISERPGWSDWPGSLSMGMSHDFPVAVEEGATHVRIGTALFGPRES